MKIHLVDGTYELFRSHFGTPPRKAPNGQEVGATLGLLQSLISLLSKRDVTHVAVAFDHVIESFRNELYAGYKTGTGIDPILFNQFSLAEEAVAKLGVVVWPMIEFEADDALATAAARFNQDQQVEQILICSPDKDLTQMVVGDKIVSWDRRRDIILNDAGVMDKFGVKPESIPDYLALVGDSADGYPGIQGWGAKSTAAVLEKFKHIENIPNDPEALDLGLGRATTLIKNLQENYEEAYLFRELSTLRKDVPLKETLDDLRWQGATEGLKKFCQDLGDTGIPEKIKLWR